jgi:hypothetical protein
MVDENGIPTQIWAAWFQALADAIRSIDERLEALEP